MTISLTFPDGAQREFPAGITGKEIAGGISPSLLKRTIAMALDGTVVDLADPITKDSRIEFLNREDPRALELIRHDAAHVLAEAVQELYPGTQVTIGPVIENGFYYDFFRNEPFTPEDFAPIEKKMREIIARDKSFTKEEWSRDKAKAFFRDKGEAFKVELVDAIPADQTLKMYAQGDWIDLCRGPHMTSVGKVGNAFKLMKVAGAYWRGDSNNPMLTRIYGTAFARQEDLDAHLKQLEEAEKRDHRKLGRRWTCSISRRRGRASCSGTPRAGACSRRSSPICAGGSPPITRRSTRRRSSTRGSGRPPATGACTRTTCSR
jgi:threonyl-tRNA synthetase